MARLDRSTGSHRALTDLGLFTVESIAREHAGPASLDVFLSDNRSGGPTNQSLIRLPLRAAPHGNRTIYILRDARFTGGPLASVPSPREPIALLRFVPTRQIHAQSHTCSLHVATLA